MRRCYYCNEPKNDDAILCEKCARELDERLGRSSGMTREEAIKVLNNHLEHWKRLVRGKICDENEGADTINAFGMAISALEQEPCDDAISRAEAIRIASGYCHFSNIPKELEKLPSVQPSHKGQTVCDLCKFNPQSSADGKPCTMCPAETMI